MGIITSLLGIVCILYYIAGVRYAGYRVSGLWIWLTAGIGLLVWGGCRIGCAVAGVPFFVPGALVAIVRVCLLAGLVLFFYLFAYHNETGGRGIRGAFSVWWQYFRGNAFFRKLFFLTFYTTMILFRTLLNRDMWMNPLSDVMANWWIWKYGEDGTRYLTTECIENLMLFIPFTILLFWTAGKKILKKTTFLNIVWTGLKITFVFSLSIELLQLFLRLGTFQVSDLTYNTLGGGIGGVVYWMGHQLSVRRGVE